MTDQEYQEWCTIVREACSTLGHEAPEKILRYPISRWIRIKWWFQDQWWKIDQWLNIGGKYDNLPKNGVLYVVQEDGTLKEAVK